MSDRKQRAIKPPKVSKIPRKKDDVECNWCGQRMKGNNIARHTERHNHEYQSYKLKGQASVANMFNFQVVKKKEEEFESGKEATESEIQEAEKEKSEKQGVEPKGIDEVKNKQEGQAMVRKKRNRQVTLFEMAGPLSVFEKRMEELLHETDEIEQAETHEKLKEILKLLKELKEIQVEMNLIIQQNKQRLHEIGDIKEVLKMSLEGINKQNQQIEEMEV